MFMYMYTNVYQNVTDMYLQVDEVRSLGVSEMATGQSLPQNVHSMNAYLGYVRVT